MAITDSDYETVIDDCRTHLLNGTQPNGTDIKLIIRVVQDAIARLGETAAASAAVAGALAFRTEWDAQITILQAGAAGDISAEVDAAEVALEAVMVDLEDAADGVGAGDFADAVAALRVTLDAQMVILQAGGAGDISGEVDTADTAIEADVVTVEAEADLAQVAGTPTVPTYDASTMLDG